MAPTHYDILEIGREASQEEIRAAYKLLVQRFHPDRNRGDASAARLTQLINDAYQVLADPQARAAYDAELERTRPDIAFNAQADDYRRREPAHPGRADEFAQDLPRGARRNPRTRKARSNASRFRGLNILLVGLCAIAAGLLLNLGSSPTETNTGSSVSAGRTGTDRAGGSIPGDGAGQGAPDANEKIRAIAPASPNSRSRISKDDEVTIGIACSPLQSGGDTTGYQACIARQRALAVETTQAPETGGSADAGARLACRLYQLNGDLAGHRECVRRESAHTTGPTAPVEVNGAAQNCVEVTTRDRTYMQCN